MSFRIPSADRRLSQPNSSEVQGNLYQTRNIDLDEEGVIKLASPMISIFDETNDAEFDNIHSVFHGTVPHFVGDNVFRQDDSEIVINGVFTNITGVDTTPPTPGADNDGTLFNGKNVISDGQTIKYENVAGTWSTISGTPTGLNTPTVLEVFPAQNSLLVGLGNKVARVNSNWTVAVTLTLPEDYQVLSIATNGNYTYIGTRHINNGEAMVFIWTGINTTNDGSFGVGTYAVPVVKKYKETAVIVDTLGRLMQFSGAGFTLLEQLPVYTKRSNWGDSNNEYENIRHRGVVVDGDLIYLNIANLVDDKDERFLANQIGNIWCYDPKVGLYQKYSYTNTNVTSEYIPSANINTTTDIFTVTSLTVPPTGSMFFNDAANTTLGGMTFWRYYFVIKITDTTFKVAETYKDSLAGNAIDITSISGASNILFHFINQKDFGQGIEDQAGAIILWNGEEYDSLQMGRLGVTALVYSPTMTWNWRLMQNLQGLRNLGYIVTPKLFTENTQDIFSSAVLRFKPLGYGDKITVKYRTEDRLKFPVMPSGYMNGGEIVTWTSNSSFTTESSPTANFLDFSTVQIGDEVEVIAGASSGFIAHVASISKSGFQYTISLDAASPFYASGDKSMVKIDNWTTLEVIDGSTFAGTEKVVSVDTSSGWAQFKIVLEGVNVTLYDNIFTTKKFEGSR